MPKAVGLQPKNRGSGIFSELIEDWIQTITVMTSPLTTRRASSHRESARNRSRHPRLSIMRSASTNSSSLPISETHCVLSVPKPAHSTRNWMSLLSLGSMLLVGQTLRIWVLKVERGIVASMVMILVRPYRPLGLGLPKVLWRKLTSTGWKVSCEVGTGTD